MEKSGGNKKEKNNKMSVKVREDCYLTFELLTIPLANLQLGLNFQQCKIDWTLNTVILREFLYSNKVNTAIRKWC